MSYKQTNLATNESEDIGNSVIDHIQANLKPDDVFTTDQLNQWALDHGFVEEDDEAEEDGMAYGPVDSASKS